MSCKTTHITQEWIQGQTFEFPITYKLDGTIQDLNGYTLEVYVVDKNDESVFSLSENIQEEAQRVVLRNNDTGTIQEWVYKYQIRIIKPDQSDVITPIQYFRIKQWIIWANQSWT